MARYNVNQMNYLLRNNEADFNKWYRHIVPFVTAKLKAYENDSVKLIFHDDEYHELLIIKKQLNDMRASMDEAHLEFFEEYILNKKLPKYGDKEGRKMYGDIYSCWQKICFPKGKSKIKELDPVLLGGELKRIRIIRGIYVKQAAELIGVSPKALYAYEEGTREMRASTLYKLCQVYKTSVNDVLNTSVS